MSEAGEREVLYWDQLSENEIDALEEEDYRNYVRAIYNEDKL